MNYFQIRVSLYTIIHKIRKKNPTFIFFIYKIVRKYTQVIKISWQSHRICARYGFDQGSSMAMVKHLFL